jgi:DNA-binding NtrC family response regulator
VRELANALQKALIFNRGRPVSQEDIARVSLMVPPPGQTPEKSDLLGGALRIWARNLLRSGNTFDSAMEQFSAMLITQALNLNVGNRSRAAKMLGLSRPTLIAKIEKYGIRFETSAVSGE